MICTWLITSMKTSTKWRCTASLRACTPGQVRIFGPRADALRPLSQEIGFTTVEMSQYATVR